MRIVLLTGFSPFGGDSENASWEAVRRLDGQHVGDVRIVARQLPTELARGPAELLASIDELAPIAVLAVGQAGGRSAISLERRFVNLLDAPIADNAGWHPRGERIVVDGPGELRPTIDVDAAIAAVRAIGIEAEASDDAGRYVCNATAYRLAHALLERNSMTHGFVHVPAIASADREGMATERVARALLAIVGTLVA